VTYIDAVQIDDTGKTLVWQLWTKARTTGKNSYTPRRSIGEVRWFGRWRGYAFFPYEDTVYEHKCLRELADFVQERTREHRRALRARRSRP
jgi:hypothetical protein